MIRAVSLAKPFIKRAVPAFGQRANTISTAPKNWMERLLSAPKGWEKYYRKPSGGSKAESAEAAGSKTGPKAEKRAGGGGGGGGGKKPEESPMYTGIAASVLIAFALTLLLSDQNSGRYV